MNKVNKFEDFLFENKKPITLKSPSKDEVKAEAIKRAGKRRFAEFEWDFDSLYREILDKFGVLNVKFSGHRDHTRIEWELGNKYKLMNFVDSDLGLSPTIIAPSYERGETIYSSHYRNSTEFFKNVNALLDGNDKEFVKNEAKKDAQLAYNRSKKDLLKVKNYFSKVESSDSELWNKINNLFLDLDKNLNNLLK